MKSNYEHIQIETDYIPIKLTIRKGSTDDQAVVREMFEQNIYKLHDNFIADTGVVVDVGANIGTFTLDILRRARNNNRPVKVLAVEPEPNNMELFKKNLDDNKWLLANNEVIMLPYAVDANGLRRVKISDEHGSSRISNEGFEVETRTIGQILDFFGIEKVDFCKIDIEGSEVEAVASMPDEVLSKIHRFAIEFDEAHDTDAFIRMLSPLLNDFSFSTFGVPSRGCNLYAENHSWTA